MSMTGRMFGLVDPPQEETNKEAISQMRSDILSLERRFLQRIDDEVQRLAQRVDREHGQSFAQIRSDLSMVQSQANRDRLSDTGTAALVHSIQAELTSLREHYDLQLEVSRTAAADLRRELGALQSEQVPALQEQAMRTASDLARSFQEITNTVALQSDHLSQVEGCSNDLATRIEDVERSVGQQQQLMERLLRESQLHENQRTALEVTMPLQSGQLTQVEAHGRELSSRMEDLDRRLRETQQTAAAAASAHTPALQADLGRLDEKSRQLASHTEGLERKLAEQQQLLDRKLRENQQACAEMTIPLQAGQSSQVDKLASRLEEVEGRLQQQQQLVEHRLREAQQACLDITTTGPLSQGQLTSQVEAAKRDLGARVEDLDLRIREYQQDRSAEITQHLTQVETFSRALEYRVEDMEVKLGQHQKLVEEKVLQQEQLQAAPDAAAQGQASSQQVAAFSRELSARIEGLERRLVAFQQDGNAEAANLTAELSERLERLDRKVEGSLAAVASVTTTQQQHQEQQQQRHDQLQQQQQQQLEATQQIQLQWQQQHQQQQLEVTQQVQQLQQLQQQPPAPSPPTGQVEELAQLSRALAGRVEELERQLANGQRDLLAETTTALQSDHLSQVKGLTHEVTSRLEDVDNKIRELQQDRSGLADLRMRVETGEGERNDLKVVVNKLREVLEALNARPPMDVSAMPTEHQLSAPDVVNALKSVQTDLVAFRARLEGVELAREACRVLNPSPKPDEHALLLQRLDFLEQQAVSVPTCESMLSRIEAVEHQLSSALGAPTAITERVDEVEKQIRAGPPGMGELLGRIEAVERSMVTRVELANNDMAKTQPIDNTVVQKIAGHNSRLDAIEAQLAEEVRGELERLKLELAVGGASRKSLSVEDIRAVLDSGMERHSRELTTNFQGQLDQLSTSRAEAHTELSGRVEKMEKRVDSMQASLYSEMQQVAGALGAHMKRQEAAVAAGGGDPSMQGQDSHASSQVVAGLQDEVQKTIRLVTRLATAFLQERRNKGATVAAAASVPTVDGIEEELLAQMLAVDAGSGLMPPVRGGTVGLPGSTGMLGGSAVLPNGHHQDPPLSARPGGSAVLPRRTEGPPLSARSESRDRSSQSAERRKADGQGGDGQGRLEWLTGFGAAERRPTPLDQQAGRPLSPRPGQDICVETPVGKTGSTSVGNTEGAGTGSAGKGSISTDVSAINRLGIREAPSDEEAVLPTPALLSDGLRESLEDLVNALHRTLLSQASPAPQPGGGGSLRNSARRPTRSPRGSPQRQASLARLEAAAPLGSGVPMPGAGVERRSSVGLRGGLPAAPRSLSPRGPLRMLGGDRTSVSLQPTPVLQNREPSIGPRLGAEVAVSHFAPSAFAAHGQWTGRSGRGAPIAEVPESLRGAGGGGGSSDGGSVGGMAAGTNSSMGLTPTYWGAASTGFSPVILPRESVLVSQLGPPLGPPLGPRLQPGGGSAAVAAATPPPPVGWQGQHATPPSLMRPASTSSLPQGPALGAPGANITTRPMSPFPGYGREA